MPYGWVIYEGGEIRDSLSHVEMFYGLFNHGTLLTRAGLMDALYASKHSIAQFLPQNSIIFTCRVNADTNDLFEFTQ